MKANTRKSLKSLKRPRKIAKKSKRSLRKRVRKSRTKQKGGNTTNSSSLADYMYAVNNSGKRSFFSSLL